ncbi:MAG: hypothetical protein IPG87_19645 [Saprospiraceae bacterium]|nr:hypothetical protein [Candidatus Vicinibacter affinis]
MIQSPGRINLIGEHTDYNKGYCLPAAIRQSLFLGISEAPAMKFRALDTGDGWGYGNQQKPHWMVYLQGVIDFLAAQGIDVPTLEMEFGGTLPMGAGLSSSSSLTCGFIFGINQFMGLNLPTETLTAWAVQAERASGLMGGMMDQISIFNGRKKQALLIDCSDWTFKYYPVDIPDFSWLIADTGVKHKLVDSDYNNRSLACARIFKTLQQNGFAGASISELPIHELSQWERSFVRRGFSAAFLCPGRKQTGIDFCRKSYGSSGERIREPFIGRSCGVEGSIPGVLCRAGFYGRICRAI